MTFDVARVRAATTPERLAVHWRGRWYDYRELDERAARLAARLHALRLGRFDRVAVLAANHIVHLDLVLATAKAGVVFTPLNHRLAPLELGAVIAALRPSLLLHDAAHEAIAEASGVESVSLETYDAWLGDHGAAPDPGVGPDDPQMILLTGGTTGLPKGAVVPYRQVRANAVATVADWGLEADDCAIQATPCFHAAINVLTTPLYHHGGRVVLMERFDPAEYLDLVATHAVTLLFMVPTMYAMLAHDANFDGVDLGSVRWAISGGAPCPDPVRARFARRGIPFRQGYGLTEAGVNCFVIDPATAQRKPWAVGTPLRGLRAEIRRPDGDPCAPGEVGELHLQGQQVFSGYFERPDETAAALCEGWLATGDLALRDDDGDVAIVGRRKEMFISGGENVYPIEVERLLYDHPGVTECVVVGVPDERWGEVGLLVVVARDHEADAGAPRLDGDALLAFLRERLAPFKVPKHVRFVTALPKNAAGKVLRGTLPELLAERPQPARGSGTAGAAGGA
ncbi:long-chain fatty acid--CoA ligase [soil metagenome]